MPYFNSRSPQARKASRKASMRWRQQHPQRARKISRKSHAANRVYDRNYASIYRRRHPEYVQRHNSTYRRRYPERAKANSAVQVHRRRARLLGNGGAFTAKQWLALKAKHGHLCLCCRKHRKLEPDHVVPLCKGGRNDIKNIQPLCGTCNRRKAAKHIDYR